MRIRLIIGVIFTVVLSAYMVETFQEFKKPVHFPEPLYDFSKNLYDAQKVEIGRALFYDPILSKDGKISCASCHSSYNSFAHTDHELSHGIHDSIGTRNAPALINLAWQNSFMRDGAIHHLDVQALAPIEHPGEMGEYFKSVVEKVRTKELYQDLFKKVYEDRLITGERMLKCLSQFQLSLISADAKYDRVIMGIDSFTIQEAKGYEVFLNNCNSCHQEPLFSSNEFVDNGLAIDSTLMDYGRMLVTKNEADAFKFKVPTLRNLTYTYPYMHDGRYDNLSEILKHYSKIEDRRDRLDPRLKNLHLITKNERVDLVAFLLALGDRKFVFDESHQFPKEILLKR